MVCYSFGTSKDDFDGRSILASNKHRLSRLDLKKRRLSLFKDWAFVTFLRCVHFCPQL